MRVTRRAFLRLAPASVGAIALGVMVWPEVVVARRHTLAFSSSGASLQAMSETMLRAGQRAADPPLMVPGGRA